MYGSQDNLELPDQETQEKSKKIIKMLHQRGVRIDPFSAQVWNHNQLKQIAILFLDKNINNLQAAIDQGAKISFQDENGNTPAHIAAYKRHYDIVDFFIRAYPSQQHIPSCKLPKYGIAFYYAIKPKHNQNLTSIKNKAGHTISDIINTNKKPTWNDFSKNKPKDIT